MRLCFFFDDMGNASIDLGDDTNYYDGMVGAIILTGQNEVPMNPLKGSQTETVLLMEDNIEEVLQMMLAGTLFPAFAENAPNILLKEAKYTKVSNNTGAVQVEYIPQFNQDIRAISVDIALR